ncbi:MAG TPA: hypothetical protein VEY11_06300 [Pyrinomonadaceae bacterium]|nr:hypothetical protein [Pyrinomonadaceae bacterium]
MKKYPDVSELFTLKDERRQRLTRLSVEEKLDITDRLRQASQEIAKQSLGGKQPTKTHAAKAG